MLHPDIHHVELAPLATNLDPALHVASMPFTTWMGNIRVDAHSVASVLRRSGDEDQIETAPSVAAAIELAFDHDAASRGVNERHLAGAWLPLRVLVPVLDHLGDQDAYETCARMAPPIVEQAPAGPGLQALPFMVRAARLDGAPGWCAALGEYPVQA